MMKLRQFSLILHRYIGAAVGLLLIVISLTGSLLVFHKEINHILNPQLFYVTPQGERLSSDSVLKNVRSTYPKLTPVFIDLPPNAKAVYEVGLTSEDDKLTYLYVNPYNGRFLGTKKWGHTLTTFIYDIHITLLAGEIGGKIVGICGFLLLSLGITGLILWPGWKKLYSGFKIRRTASKRLINYDIHKLSGILSAGFLILLAATGTAMIFWTQFEPTVYWLTKTEKTVVKSTVIAGKSPIKLVTALEIADRTLPGAQTTFISIPSQPDGVLRVTKKFPQEISPQGTSRVSIDQYSGKVLRVENALKPSLAMYIINLVFPLHTGSYGGIAMRVIYVIVGLIPAVLTITGFVLWRYRQWDKARRQAAIEISQKIQKKAEQEYYWGKVWHWF